MRKSGFNFSEQNKKELLFFLIIPVLNHKYFQVLAALPKNGVDLSMEEPESGKTPAICAAKGGLSTALSKLSELGVDVNAANSQSHTAAYFAQAELLTAITEEQRSKYSNVLIALNQACINQTDEEHRKAQSSVCSFFPRMTYEARLKNNLMKAGLGKYDSLVEHASRVVYA